MCRQKRGASPQPWGHPLFTGPVKEKEAAKEMEKEQPERWEEDPREQCPGGQGKEVFWAEGNQVC